MFGGDPGAIEDLARQVRALADRAGEAGRRLRSASAVAWASTAAERFRDRLGRHARTVDALQDGLRDAARLLDELAGEVRRRQAAIVAAEHLVLSLLRSARDQIESLLGLDEDALSTDQQDALDTARAFVCDVGRTPPTGAPEWLELADRVTAGHRGA